MHTAGIRRRPGGVGGGPAPHVRHHLPPRRRQDHPHREVPALRRRARPPAPARSRRAEGRRSATSDWMELEQQRGISITSTVLQFPYRDCVVNLLDTPGHRDFSEDTYRVLAAADAAVMVLDAAKGIEPQTLKLFEVCRARGLPLLTFINKWDRPGPRRARAARRDRGADRRHPVAGHVAGRHRRRLPRRDRPPDATSSSASPASPAAPPRPPRRSSTPERAAGEEGAAWTHAVDELDLLDGRRRRLRRGAVPRRRAVADVLRLGAHQLRRPAAARRASSTSPPPPAPASDVDGKPRPLDAPFSGFVFKVQANMDPSHRDRIAFLRVCSGRFERGMVVTHGPTGKPFATKYAHSVFGQERETVEEAFPGDVVGLVNATDVRVGDTLYVDEPVVVPDHPELRPRALRGRPGARHRPVQAVPQGHRPARRGGRRAGPARPRPRRPGPGARRGRADAVRGGRAPARARVRCAGRAQPDRLHGRPPHRRGERDRAAVHAGRRRARRGPTARCSRCSRAATGSTGSPASSPSSPSSRWSPESSPADQAGQRVPSPGGTSSTR